MVLAYNLLRYQMVRDGGELKGPYGQPVELHMASVYLLHELSCLPFVSPGMVPGRVAELDKQAEQFATRPPRTKLPKVHQSQTTEVCDEKT